MKRYMTFLAVILTIALLTACGGGATFEYSESGSYGNIQHGISTAPDGNGPTGWIVVFKDNVGDVQGKANEIAAEHGVKPGFVYEYAIKGFSVELPEQAIEGIRHNPNVEYVEPDGVVTMCKPPSPPPPPPPPPQPDQVLPWGIDRIDAENNTNGGSGVTVAVLDTGIDLDHPDLAANLKTGKNFVNTRKSADDDNGHGTHVAGIIAAVDNTIGVVGVAPSAKLVPVKVLNSSGTGSFSTIIAGINWVIQNKTAKGIKVANMSFGGYGTYSSFHTAIQNLKGAGVVIAAAAGNEERDVYDWSFIPAVYPEVLCVTALDTNNNLAWYSNFCDLTGIVDLIAPGSAILSTVPGGYYAEYSGTSMASPHAAGVAALYMSKYPSASVDTAMEALKTNGKSPLYFFPDGNGQWPGDTDGIAEPMVYALGY